MEPHTKVILAARTSHTKATFYNIIGFAYRGNDVLVLFVLIEEPKLRKKYNLMVILQFYCKENLLSTIEGTKVFIIYDRKEQKKLFWEGLEELTLIYSFYCSLKLT